MNAALLGLGEWLPDDVRTNDFWPESIVARWRQRSRNERGDADQTLVATPDATAEAFMARSLAAERGDVFVATKRRRIAGAQERSCETSARAAGAALFDARIDAKQVDAVLAFEAVPDRPMTGAAKIAELAGATNATGMTVDSGCASPIVQLQLACALIESSRARYVLCTQSFLFTRTYPLAHPVSPLVGDAATAFVVGRSEHPSVLSIESSSAGAYYDAVCWIRGHEEEADTPWWSPGGPFLCGSRDRARAEELIRNTPALGAQSLRRAAERARIDPRSLDLIISTHPRRWVPGSIAELLGVSVEKACHTFEETAHIGGCCLVTNLLEARRRGLVNGEAVIGLYTQGVGFTSGSAILHCRVGRQRSRSGRRV